MAEKKGFLHQLIVGKDKAEGYARASLPSNRWELFFDIVKGRFWKLVLLNIMMLIGLILPLMLLLYNYLNKAALDASLPYSAHIGAGYPIYEDLKLQGMYYASQLEGQMFLLLIPALMIAGVVCSGIFYIMRNLVWSEGVFIAPDFWKGLKDNILHFLLIFFMLGVVIWMTRQSSNLAAISIAAGDGNFFISLSSAAVVIVSVLFGIMCLYMMTLTVTYKLKFFQLIRNAFILTLGLFLPNLLFAALTFSPIILTLLLSPIMPSILSFVLMIYLLLGFSGGALIWTTYSHWVFDRFINDRVEGAQKNRGIYPKVNMQGEFVERRVKSSQLLKRRPLKPVNDEDVVISELPANFTRADLLRLAEEKERMREDAERWSEEHEGDPEIVSGYIVEDDEDTPAEEAEQAGVETADEEDKAADEIAPEGRSKGKKGKKHR